MSGSLNKVMLIGNLARDPEVRTFDNGGKVCNLRLITNETWTDRDGTPRASLELTADRVRFLGDREADEEGKAPPEVKEEATGDEIPF